MSLNPRDPGQWRFESSPVHPRTGSPTGRGTGDALKIRFLLQPEHSPPNARSNDGWRGQLKSGFESRSPLHHAGLASTAERGDI